ncbi:MAG: hypothetical protein FD170_2817 [Bacteroidetes bacterium]|nr:MAG: hypothetical protein FD170_2817 [Bacteroidota bacterium]
MQVKVAIFFLINTLSIKYECHPEFTLKIFEHNAEMTGVIVTLFQGRKV